MSQHQQISRQLQERGFAVVRLDDAQPVVDARQAVLAKLRRLTSDASITLEHYHRLDFDDARHTEIQFQLTTLFRREGFARRIAEANLSLLAALAGGDLDIQTQPFLRITRPHKPQDNVGFHRDTFYGDSPWAMNLSLPLVDVPAEAALCILAGSHVWAESDVPFAQSQDAEVTKGSVRHQLGFAYAPKVIDARVTAQVEPAPAALGEAVAFAGAIVHGTVANNASTCRWTTDIRFISAQAPVNANQRSGYYEPLCRCAMTRIAHAYAAANPPRSEAA
jgi:ectoine hydroxylase-related dioxygenase (phytanoyl-CoA dioxygenase family)